MTLAAASYWLTASEIAEQRLPGLPADKRAVNAHAAAMGWADAVGADGSPLARKRAARGGGMEYHASLFPPEAQQRLATRIDITPIAANDTDDGLIAWAWFDQQPAHVKAEAEKRLTILNEIEARVLSGSTKTAATASAAIRHGCTDRTIRDWFGLVFGVPRADWLPRLAPQRKGGRDKAEIDVEAWRILKTDYLRPEKPSFSACYNRLVEDYAKPKGIVLPNKKTLERRLAAEISKLLKTAKREGKEQARRTVPPMRRTVADLHAMKAVNTDGHTFDVFVQWEDGRIGRPVMVGIQDIFSRKLLAHRIDETESMLLARMAFADLFRDWGIPAEAVLDNGRAFASKAMTGGAKTRHRFKIKDSDPTGVLTSLNITTHWTMPYRGSSKPIERAWRDLCEDISKHPAVAGAYTGNKPDAKPENYRDRAIPIAEFRAHVARRIAAHNARTGRNTEMAKGDSFDAVFAASYAVSPIGKASDAQLRRALLVAEDRRCHRLDGSIRLAGNIYWSPEMVELAGEKVSVRCDPDNLHSEIHVYRQGDGEYLHTIPVLEAVGFFDKAGAERRGKLEKDVRRKVRAAEEAAELLRIDQVAELLSGPVAPAPQPVAGVVRPVRHRGQTAAAIKPIQQADAEPAAPDFMDAFTAGTRRLRAVE
ncbi:transposase domain-containing protein [Sphingobium sp. IP1]|uniref:transposase domain-containing protein n=1 Tax=Sphingobium sp. IP1 TaxID=2021637 RepID=UPI0015D4BFF3|nr:transposase domain-containing protein [Sphingobium sp. IP1]